MRIPGFDEEGELFLGFSDEDFVFPCFSRKEKRNDEISMSDERPDPPRADSEKDNF